MRERIFGQSLQSEKKNHTKQQHLTSKVHLPCDNTMCCLQKYSVSLFNYGIFFMGYVSVLRIGFSSKGQEEEKYQKCMREADDFCKEFL